MKDILDKHIRLKKELTKLTKSEHPCFSTKESTTQEFKNPLIITLFLATISLVLFFLTNGIFNLLIVSILSSFVVSLLNPLFFISQSFLRNKSDHNELKLVVISFVSLFAVGLSVAALFAEFSTSFNFFLIGVNIYNFIGCSLLVGFYYKFLKGDKHLIKTNKYKCNNEIEKLEETILNSEKTSLFFLENYNDENLKTKILNKYFKNQSLESIAISNLKQSLNQKNINNL